MKKNLVKKAVLPVFVALLCSVIALTSVSYAWFSLGNKATVEGMEMNVTTADGLQISLTGDASDFKSTLDLDLTDEKAKTVNPVSTNGTYASGLTFYTGQIVDGKLDKVAVDTAATNYITFDIYVKVTSDTKLLLDSDSAVTIKGEKETYLAARVAFVDLGSKEKPADAKNLNPTEGTVRIWEPNSDKRSKAAANANAGTGKLAYEGIASVEGGTVSTNNVTTFDFIDTNAGKSVELFELEAGYNKVRVYIWLEGQDVDCVNEVSGGAFTVTLKLSKPQAQNPQA